MFPKLCTHYNDLFGCDISQIVQKDDIYYNLYELTGCNVFQILQANSVKTYLAVVFSRLCKQIMFRLIWIWRFLDHVNKQYLIACDTSYLTCLKYKAD